LTRCRIDASAFQRRADAWAFAGLLFCLVHYSLFYMVATEQLTGPRQAPEVPLESACHRQG
jgi:hypothetical protein